MVDYSKIINNDYWIIDNFVIQKVRIIDYIYDEPTGQITVVFVKFVARLEQSPLLFYRSIFDLYFEETFYESIDDATIKLVKIFLSIDFIIKNNLYYSEDHVEYFDRTILETLIKQTVDEFPDKFI